MLWGDDGTVAQRFHSDGLWRLVTRSDKRFTWADLCALDESGAAPILLTPDSTGASWTGSPAADDEWLDRAVTLRDHFDSRMTLRVAQPQPQYGTVQLNSEYKGIRLSLDVNLAELLAALESVAKEPSDD
jgi:hypothetical protein